MIKGTRVQATNNSATIPAYAGALMSGYGMLTLPTNKTFVLTDLICAFTPTLGSGLSPAGVALMDKAFGAGISAFTGGDIKVVYGNKMINASVNDLNSATPGPLVLTDIENGPEFTTCVTAGAIGSYAIPTFGLWIAGVLR